MRVVMGVLAVLAAFGVSVYAAGDAPVAGVGGAASGKTFNTSEVDAGIEGTIDFDANPAPCVFAETVPLRRYTGVRFKGDSPINGGAILDECGNFGVTGHSPPNFLAFNCGAQMQNGGIPRLPEKIIWPGDVTGLSVKIGSGLDNRQVKLIGTDSVGNRQRRTVTLTSALQTVSFTQAVKSLKITSPAGACVLVVDDLNWD